MHKLFLAVLTAGAMLCGAAHAAATYSDLAAWQAAAGSYSRDTDYGADSTGPNFPLGKP